MTPAQSQEQTPPKSLSCGILSDAKTDILLLTVLWLASLSLVQPIGNFPLNDDWAFARTVKHLLQTGEYYPTPWAAMPLVTQTLWGALFCLSAGFSFSALRCSTLVMSFAALLFTYTALRHVHPSRFAALVGSLTLLFNPIFFALSNTFMTDVPFTAIMLGAAVFLFRNLVGGSTFDFVMGSSLAVAATLSRQLALAIPASFCLCLIWMRGLRRGWWARALAPLLLSIAGLLGYHLWLKTTGRLPASFDKMNLRVYWMLSDAQLILTGLNRHLGAAALYLGWFAIPMAALSFYESLTMRKRMRVFLAAFGSATAFILCFAGDLIHLRALMPATGNILVPQGIGPLTLSGALDRESTDVPSIGNGFWLVVTIIAVLGGALLLGGLVAGVCRNWRAFCVWKLPPELAGSVFFLTSLGGYLFTILVVGGWDRYYLPALPLLLAGVAALAAEGSAQPPRERRKFIGAPPGFAIIACCLLVFMAFISICGTHDYFSWNRARWKALTALTAGRKVTPEDVDGGFEFNGWYLYSPDYKSPRGKNFWWVHRDDYMVAFARQPGYGIAEKYQYSNWLPPAQRKILVLKKEDQSANHVEQ